MTAVAEAWRTFRRWPFAVRWSLHLAVLLVVVLIAGLITSVVLVRRSFPQLEGTVEVPGLEGMVEVIRDEQGIPQIYADTLPDLMRAQGYVHAQDRFYEMDIRRHITAGRLSELFGETTLETDKVIRTMGWRRVASREWALLAPETRAALEAYSAGVNAWLEDRAPGEMALEYTLLRFDGLDYHPAKWTPVDSLAWLKAMAWDLRGNMEEEIGRALVGETHSEEQVAELYPDYPYDEHTPIVTEGALVDGRYEPRASGPGTRDPARPAYEADQLAALEKALGPIRAVPELIGQGDGVGSNSWVVSGDLTESGKPLLANDPHLATSLPGVWYQVGLHCRQLSPACPIDVSGFSFSGLPGVVIGHNQDIAWGFTNLGPDVTDLFLERLEGGTWEYDGEQLPLKVRTETIEVRDGDDFELTVRETDHGPLLSDVSDELSTVGANAGGYAVALKWTALEADNTADALLALNAASDWNEFRAAAADFAVPAQNLVYADTEGNIGYQAPGEVPIRRSGNDGRTPARGWLKQDDWTGTHVQFEALPNVLNPEEGFVVTANQAVVGPGYPLHLTDDWDAGYRSQRIRDLLVERDGKVDTDDMTALQLDDRSALADVLVPHLLQLTLPRGYQRDGQAELKTWDRRADAESSGAAYFNVVWRNLLELTFHDELRESLWPGGGARWWLAVTHLLQDPTNAWWDDKETDVVETRDDILRAAMLAASDEIIVRLARDPSKWEWGRLHTLELENQTLGTSGNGFVERLLNRSRRVGGGSSLVNATDWNAAEGYAVTSAPSMRMVVDLADLDASRWVNLTGASGHAFHANYTDQADLFVEGRTLRWRFSRDAVDDAVEHRLVLEPTP